MRGPAGWRRAPPRPPDWRPAWPCWPEPNSHKTRPLGGPLRESPDHPTAWYPGLDPPYHRFDQFPLRTGCVAERRASAGSRQKAHPARLYADRGRSADLTATGLPNCWPASGCPRALPASTGPTARNSGGKRRQPARRLTRRTQLRRLPLPRGYPHSLPCKSPGFRKALCPTDPTTSRSCSSRFKRPGGEARNDLPTASKGINRLLSVSRRPPPPRTSHRANAALPGATTSRRIRPWPRLRLYPHLPQGPGDRLAATLASYPPVRSPLPLDARKWSGGQLPTRAGQDCAATGSAGSGHPADPLNRHSRATALTLCHRNAVEITPMHTLPACSDPPPRLSSTAPIPIGLQRPSAEPKPVLVTLGQKSLLNPGPRPTSKRRGGARDRYSLGQARTAPGEPIKFPAHTSKSGRRDPTSPAHRTTNGRPELTGSWMKAHSRRPVGHPCPDCRGWSGRETAFGWRSIRGTMRWGDRACDHPALRALLGAGPLSPIHVTTHRSSSRTYRTRRLNAPPPPSGARKSPPLDPPPAAQATESLRTPAHTTKPTIHLIPQATAKPLAAGDPTGSPAHNGTTHSLTPAHPGRTCGSTAAAVPGPLGVAPGPNDGPDAQTHGLRASSAGTPPQPTAGLTHPRQPPRPGCQ